MKKFKLRFISISLVILSTLFVLTGCGTQSSASSTTGTSNTASTTKTEDSSLIKSQQQVKMIDIKASKGQQEVNAQINKNLNNLDKSLNALDGSLGSL
ncbi:hypothetical protein [Desulfosporosinus sp. SB140]|uniref:hypothetical protein n=1 Tax=Desulfosporosinus paludis TaxID=3115649 RepID=UPI00388D0B03